MGEVRGVGLGEDWSPGPRGHSYPIHDTYMMWDAVATAVTWRPHITTLMYQIH